MVHQVQQVLQVRLASQESQVDLKEEMKHLFGSFPGLDVVECDEMQNLQGKQQDHIVKETTLALKDWKPLYYIHRKELTNYGSQPTRQNKVHQSHSFVIRSVLVVDQMDTLVAKFIINKNLCFVWSKMQVFLAILEKAFPGQHIELAQFRQIRSVLKRDEIFSTGGQARVYTFPKLFEAARILFAIPAYECVELGDKKQSTSSPQTGRRKLELAPIVEEADFDEVNELQEDSNSVVKYFLLLT
uniref:Uncharacterized protein n=1 Tax=Ditylenchus dipsaci TaxID=166011 RepID=A0A915DFW4_9BILA